MTRRRQIKDSHADRGLHGLLAREEAAFRTIRRALGRKAG